MQGAWKRGSSHPVLREIVPIVKKTGDGEYVDSFLGTATVMFDKLTCVTAAHVVRDLSDPSTIGAGYETFGDGRIGGIRASSIHLHESLDIAVIKLRGPLNSVPPFTRVYESNEDTHDLGQFVVAYGYYDQGNRRLADHILRGYVQRRDANGDYILSFPLVEGNSGAPLLPDRAASSNDGVMGIMSGTATSQARLLEEVFEAEDPDGRVVRERTQTALVHSRAVPLAGLEEWIKSPV